MLLVPSVSETTALLSFSTMLSPSIAPTIKCQWQRQQLWKFEAAYFPESARYDNKSDDFSATEAQLTKVTNCKWALSPQEQLFLQLSALKSGLILHFICRTWERFERAKWYMTDPIDPLMMTRKPVSLPLARSKPLCPLFTLLHRPADKKRTAFHYPRTRWVQLSVVQITQSLQPFSPHMQACMPLAINFLPAILY